MLTFPYLSDPGDEYEIRVFDTLRGLVAASPLAAGRYQGTIRQFPATTAREKDGRGILLPPLVSIYCPMETDDAAVTMGGSGVGKWGSEMRGTMIVLLFENPQGANPLPDETIPIPEGGDANDYLDGLYRRLHNFTGALKRTLVTFRQDPTPGNTRLWHNLTFASPTTVLHRSPGEYLRSITNFDLHALRRTP